MIVDLAFINELKDSLYENIKSLKRIELYQLSTKTQFPLLVISYDGINTNQNTIDSSREIKYVNITLSLDFFTTETKEKNKYESCIEIKNEVISFIANSDKFKNLLLTQDRNLPNFDESYCRWRLNYRATIDCSNNSIL